MRDIRGSSGEVVRIPLGPEARLRGALHMLEVRLGEQKAAIAAWRANLEELTGTVRALAASAAICEQILDASAGPVAAARSAAADLTRSAGMLMAATGMAQDIDRHPIAGR